MYKTMQAQGGNNSLIITWKIDKGDNDIIRMTSHFRNMQEIEKREKELNDDLKLFGWKSVTRL